jgi:hypothetical protein
MARRVQVPVTASAYQTVELIVPDEWDDGDVKEAAVLRAEFNFEFDEIDGEYVEVVEIDVDDDMIDVP